MIDKTDKNIVYHLILRKPAQNRLAIHNTSVSSTIAFPGFSYKIFFIELITFLNPLHTKKKPSSGQLKFQSIPNNFLANIIKLRESQLHNPKTRG